MEGRYLALVGDDMFKEGFDYEPMKNIFDTPHGSLVEKAQILGRGARRWYNTRKDRYEGMTLIDTIVYIGDDDPDVEKQLRREALSRAITAVSILDGVTVMAGEYVPPSVKPIKLVPQADIDPLEGLNNGQSEADVVFDREIELTHTTQVPSQFFGRPFVPIEAIQGQAVEEFTTEEDVRTFFAEIENIKTELGERRQEFENYIDLTADMRAKLKSESNRTGLSGVAICSAISNPPDGLMGGVINDWLSGRTKSVNPVFWRAVLDTYGSQPSNTNVQYYPLTDEMRKQIKSEIRRTKGLVKIFSDSDGKPSDLTITQARYWTMPHAKSVGATHWDWVILKLKALPTLLTITNDMFNMLTAEMERTNIKSHDILKNKPDVPSGLTSSLVNHVRNKSSTKKTIREDHWLWLIKEFQNTADILTLTEEMAADLKKEANRSGVGAMGIIKSGNNVPDGLTWAMVQYYFAHAGNRPVTLRKDYYDWILNTLRALPAKAAKIEITSEMRNHLIEEMTRTRKGPGLIIKGLGADSSALTEPIIKNWAGNIKSANAADWQKVIDYLHEQPTILKVTAEMQSFLKAEHNRIGMGASEVLKNTSSPNGLSVKKIFAISSSPRAVIDKADWDWYVAKVSAYPTIKPE